MAGIQFELKKAFSRKGLFALLSAYGYASVICAGPTILGIVFLLGIRIVGTLAGASENDLRILNAVVTYTLLASLLFINIFSVLVTRYTADQIYKDDEDKVMPSFIGSISVILAVGCPIYGIFLHFSGINLLTQIVTFLLFGELIIVWSEINYLTAIKDYRSIMVAYLVSILVAFGISFFLAVLFHILPTLITLLISITVAYGIMAVWYFKLLMEYFPIGNCSALYFFKWMDKFPQLAPIGLLTSLGLFAHLVMMWYSSSGNVVVGFFRECPMYDISALVAFLSILPTTVNFVTSVEVNFYPTYRNFFSLLNDGGTLPNIEIAERDMENTLKQELSYTFMRQFFAIIVFIVVGTLLLPILPLGFTDEMLGIYRVLCCAYAFYAVGNTVMLMQLYFADGKGALYSSIVFAAGAILGTLAFGMRNSVWFGVGFLLGGVLYTIVSLVLLKRYLDNTLQNILGRSAIKVEEPHGPATRIGDYFEKRYEEMYGIAPAEETVKEG